MIRDLREAVRALARHPALTLTVVVTLALGSTLFTATFAFIDAIFWRPLPYPGVERLVGLEEFRDVRRINPEMRAATYAVVRESARSFSHVAAASEGEINLAAGDVVERVAHTAATADAFRALRTPPLLGRHPAGSTGAGREVAIGEGLWERVFARDPQVLGRHVALDGEPAVVVGVLPRRFEFYRHSELWTVLDEAALLREPERWLLTFARLRDGVTREQAEAELAALATRIKPQVAPEVRDYRFVAYPQIVTRNPYPPQVVVILLGSAAIVLLATYLNVAAVLLARALGRRGDFALRAALGAGRVARVRHAVAESVLLVAVASAVGVALTAAVARLVWAGTAAHLPDWMQVQVDWRVLAAALGAGAVGVVVACVPAVRVSGRAGLSQVIATGQGLSLGASARVPRAAHTLVAGQVAFACLLVMLSVLMFRSWRALSTVEFGVEGDRTLLVWVGLTGRRYELGTYDGARGRAAYADAAVERLRAIPGVAHVSRDGQFGGWWDELRDAGGATGALTVNGRTRVPSRMGRDEIYTEDGRLLAYRAAILLTHEAVDDGYFAALGLRRQAGRLFGPADAEGTPPVVVLSEAVARRLWPDLPPDAAVGRRFRFGATGRWVTVVGTVSDVHRVDGSPQATQTRPTYALYFPAAQADPGYFQLIVRAADGIASPTTLAPAVREALAQVDPAVPVQQIRSYEDSYYGNQVSNRGWMARVVATCGLATLALAGVGLYGLLSTLVVLRRREIGVRLALGATPRSIALLLSRESLRRVAKGAGVGLVASVPLSSFMGMFLFRASVLDVASLLLVLGVLGVGVLAAIAAPLWRASRTDPAAVLRQ